MAEFFAVVLCGAMFVGVVALGWWLAMQQLQAERHQLYQQRQLLDTEWQALDQTRRVREVFWTARRAMQHRADDGERPGGGGA